MTPAIPGLSWRPDPVEVFRRPLLVFPCLDRWLIRALLWALGPLVRVEGPENLTVPGPVIFAFTHTTFFETLFATLVLYYHRQERVGFMVDWMYGRLPGIRWLIAKVDPVFVWNKRSMFFWINQHKGGRPPFGAWEEGLHRLAKGRALALFPEGKAHRDPARLRKGRKGLGHMVLASAARVVPVGIDFPALKRLGRVPYFGRIVFRVGEAMAFPAEARTYLEAADPRQRGRYAQSVTHQVMAELARLAGRSYAFGAPLAADEC